MPVQELDLGWASVGQWLLGAPLQIVLTIVLAVVVRTVAHRAIDTAVDRAIARSEAARAKRDHKRSSGMSSSTVRERYRQRTLTTGSLLRSIATIVIATVTVLTVLALLDIPLAPLLASAGVGGVALGFGAQALVKDYLSGIFMILEDQYGVGDIVDLGEAGGTVENVGLWITTVRDVRGVVWYIRNGEILRVGNKSQGWAQVVIDVPMPFGTDLEKAHEVLTESAAQLTEEDEYKDDLLAPPEVLGVEQMTATGLMLRVTVRTTTAAQWRVARELRARISADLDAAGITSGITPTPAPAPPA